MLAVFSFLMMFWGSAILALVLVQPPVEKVAIVLSTLGLLLILGGAYKLEGQTGPPSTLLSSSWIRYLPTVVIALGFVAVGLAPRATSAFILAGGLALIFLLNRAANVSKPYVALLTVFAVGAIGYGAFRYYPAVIGIDPYGYLSVASAITQTGHYSDVILTSSPIASYYSPFPVMSIASSILSSVSGIDLQLSLLVFPGGLILLQPLLVFLVSRSVMNDAEAAVFSAFIVATEPAVIRSINSPIAESAAMSALLLVLIALFGRVKTRTRGVVAMVIFLIAVAIHGAVGLVAIVLIPFLVIWGKRSHDRGMIIILVLIFLVYITIAAVAERLLVNAEWIWTQAILKFISAPALLTGGNVYGTGSSGLIFIWWGLPASLALLSILVLRRKEANPWAYAGLGLLGLSFAINLIAPDLVVDRYGGLAAWLVLAVAGGKALTALTRTSRQLIAVVPVILLVCLSCVVAPTVSPQYADAGYLQVLPTTGPDRTALGWVEGHVIGDVTTDSYSWAYLIFSRYASGVFSMRGIIQFYRADPIPGPHEALFVRWSNPFTVRGPDGHCHGLISELANKQAKQTLNILYSNSCDLLEQSPNKQ